MLVRVKIIDVAAAYVFFVVVVCIMKPKKLYKEIILSDMNDIDR